MKDPIFKLNNRQLPYVEEAKCLGVYIHKDGTDHDVKNKWGNIMQICFLDNAKYHLLNIFVTTCIVTLSGLKVPKTVN